MRTLGYAGACLVGSWGSVPSLSKTDPDWPKFSALAAAIEPRFEQLLVCLVAGVASFGIRLAVVPILLSRHTTSGGQLGCGLLLLRLLLGSESYSSLARNSG